jgi:hypothetical protein
MMHGYSVRGEAFGEKSSRLAAYHCVGKRGLRGDAVSTARTYQPRGAFGRSGAIWGW